MTSGSPIVSPNTVTLDIINSKIKSVVYSRFPDTTITICVITLENGFTVIGESACADPANFNEQKGAQYARDNAFEKIWPLEGYLLKQRLFEQGVAK